MDCELDCAWDLPPCVRCLHDIMLHVGFPEPKKVSGAIPCEFPGCDCPKYIKDNLKYVEEEAEKRGLQ